MENYQELTAKECLDAIYRAVGNHSTQELSIALENSSMADALLIEADTEFNVLSLAIKTGDERIIQVFENYGVDVAGWMGSHRWNAFHDIAGEPVNDVADVEAWFLERASHLIMCPYANGETPLELLVKKSKSSPEDIERFNRWMDVNLASGDMEKPVYSTLDKLAHASLNFAAITNENPIAKQVPPEKIWKALAKRTNAWGHQGNIPHIVSAKIKIPNNLLLLWAETPMENTAAYLSASIREARPHDATTASWISKQESIDPTLKNEAGFTAIELGILNYNAPYGGWVKGLCMSKDLLHNYLAQGSTHTIETIAPKLPELLTWLLLKASAVFTNEYKKELDDLWKKASIMDGFHSSLPQPATHDFVTALFYYRNLSDPEKKAAFSEASMFLKTQSASKKNTKTMRL